jgi:hypothetical protein
MSKNRIHVVRVAIGSAFALFLSLPATSQAANLGPCQNNVCKPTSLCTDTCTYDGGQSGSTTCGSMTSGNCVSCWTANVDTVIGVHSNFFVKDHVSRNVYFKCSNGSSTFIRNECVTKTVGVCLSNCPDYGARCN